MMRASFRSLAVDDPHPLARPALRSRPSLAFLLLLLLLVTLWIAGGASYPDAPGQVVVRGTAWLLLLAAILFGERPSLNGGRAVVLVLLGALLIALVQLVPLPPGIWQALPGRAAFVEAAAAASQPQPWRPWSIVPGATVNAASSLIVPFTTLLLVAGLKEAERLWLPGLLLGLIATATFVGMAQFSGIAFENPLLNNMAGQVSGVFANRNHFALFLAFGCILAPAWAFPGGRRPGWRAPVALGLVVLFALTILASGSRAGLFVGALALVIGLLLARRSIRTELGRHPRWVFPTLIVGVVGLIAIAVVVSVAADRAVSISRALEIDRGQDMRARGFPTVLAMARTYFPWGSGLGGFDPMFRMSEPFELLKPTYFNHVHNDPLEIALDAGVPGLLVMAGGLLWWAWASLRVWRSAGRDTLSRAGSAMLLLVLIASLIDYPARTPLVMAMMVLAAMWLARGAAAAAGSALPLPDQHL